MSKGKGVRVLAILNILAGALALVGGAEAAAFSWGEATLAGAVGTAGALVGLLLIVSGVALGRRGREATVLAYAAGTGAVIVYLTGVGLGIIGVSGLIVGVLYPAVMMLWLRRAAPPSVPGLDTRTSPPPEARPTENGHLRTRLA
jgi:hypothetical protein